MATAHVNGVNLYYEETGSGFPLIWCHEFGGDYRSWEPQVRYIPHAGLVMLPMTGHTANIEEPALFNLHVSEFLAAVENGRWGSWKAEKPSRR
jgi:pimeloyl-ACP methyl ester carboxylesterase